MELDDLKAEWRVYDEALRANASINVVLLTRASREEAERRLRPLERGVLFELALNLLAVILLGFFIAAHFSEPRFALPATLADLCAIVLCAAGIRQIVGLRSIDRARSIVEIQKRIKALELLRVRTTVGTLLFAPVLWVPIAIVLAKALFDVDLYALGWPWLAANLAFGLIVLGVGLTAARLVAARGAGSPLGRRIARDLAGRSLRDAQAALASLRAFELDETAA